MKDFPAGEKNRTQKLNYSPRVRVGVSQASVEIPNPPLPMERKPPDTFMIPLQPPPSSRADFYHDVV
jgi:hypothetical protein